MATLIGVTAGEIYNKIDPWAPLTYGQSKTYTDSVIHAKGVPLIIPLTTELRTLRTMYETMDGILFAGGNDINPQLYGQKPYKTTVNVSDYRDECEKQLMIWALEDKKPILAICRGMQLLNALRGGSIYQHINADLPEAEDHSRSSSLGDIEHLAHELSVKPGSKLAKALGVTTIQTNTHHHQAINLMAPDLEAVAWAEDGVIEALESKDASFVIGIQSHPESLVEKAEKAWLNLFESFVRAAAK